MLTIDYVIHRKMEQQNKADRPTPAETKDEFNLRVANEIKTLSDKIVAFDLSDTAAVITLEVKEKYIP